MDVKLRPDENPAAKVAPLATSLRQLAMYDPKTEKGSLINPCISTHDLCFARDAKNSLWISRGDPASVVVGWFNTKLYDETRGDVKAEGWTSTVTVVDTVGNASATPLWKSTSRSIRPRTSVNFHGEGGIKAQPEVFKLQIRPNPLAG